MKCPHCRQFIECPTQKQFLAWYYRYIKELSLRDVAKRMKIDKRSVMRHLRGFREVWPSLAPKFEPRSRVVPFNENIHSEPQMRF